MLKKIFKYEWKAISPLLLAVHIVGLVITVFCRIGIELVGGVNSLDNSIMATLLLMISIVAIGCIMAYTYFYTGYRFYKNVFTQQGYLTNTLPVTADQLIWGKGLTSVIWMVLSFLWAIVALLVVVASPSDVGEIFHGLPRLIGDLFSPDTPVFAKLAALAVLLSPFFMVIQFYVSASIGNLFTGHKLLGTVGVYLGIYFLQQVVGIILLVNTAPQLTSLEQHLEREATAASIRDYTYGALNYTLIFSLIFSLVLSAVFYALCRYMLNHRLNLE